MNAEPTTYEIVLSLRQESTAQVVSSSVAVTQYLKDAADRLEQQAQMIGRLLDACAKLKAENAATDLW